MDKVKKEKIYALTAAILFAVYTIYTICNDVYFRLEDLKAFPEYGINIASVIWSSLFYISLIIITVGLFCKSKITLTVGAGAYVLLNAIPFILDLIFEKYPAQANADFMYYILKIAAYAVLCLLLISSYRKAGAVIMCLWLLPSLLILIYCIIYYAVMAIEYSFYIISVKGIVVGIIEAVALVFAGLWLKSSAQSTPAKEEPVGGYGDRI